MLRYMKYALYKLEKTIIIFKEHRPINAKSCWSTFNYSNFYAISHFVWYIWDYSSVVNYNTFHSKAAYKYYLKAFYNRTIKKDYNLPIRQYNIWYTNLIIIKDIIILAEKGKNNKELLVMENVGKIAIVEVGKMLNIIDFNGKHN